MIRQSLNPAVRHRARFGNIPQFTVFRTSSRSNPERQGTCGATPGEVENVDNFRPSGPRLRASLNRSRCTRNPAQLLLPGRQPYRWRGPRDLVNSAELLQSVKFFDSAAFINFERCGQPAPPSRRGGSSAGFQFRRATRYLVEKSLLLCFQDCGPYMLAVIAVLLEKRAVATDRQLAVRPLERDIVKLRSLHRCAYFGRRALANLHAISHEVFFAAISGGCTEPLCQNRRELASQAGS